MTSARGASFWASLEKFDFFAISKSIGEAALKIMKLWRVAKFGARFYQRWQKKKNKRLLEWPSSYNRIGKQQAYNLQSSFSFSATDKNWFSPWQIGLYCNSHSSINCIFISEFPDDDVVPIGYKLTNVCIGNRSRDGDSLQFVTILRDNSRTF